MSWDPSPDFVEGCRYSVMFTGKGPVNYEVFFLSPQTLCFSSHTSTLFLFGLYILIFLESHSNKAEVDDEAFLLTMEGSTRLQFKFLNSSKGNH